MKKILLVISLISVLLLTGCNSNNNESVNVDYENLTQEVARKDETIKELERQINDMQGKVSKNGIETNSNDISVVDAVNYSYDSKIGSKNDMFKVVLPKVIGNTDTIETLNTKILNESLPLTYTFLAEKVEEPTVYENGASIEYKNIIENNILVLYIDTNLPAGTKGMGIAGVESSYYYDTENDKLLSVGEAAEALEMKLDGLTSRDEKVLNTYNDLDECNDYMIVIGENGLEFKFLN